jgi:hypothetical protein
MASSPESSEDRQQCTVKTAIKAVMFIEIKNDNHTCHIQARGESRKVRCPFLPHPRLAAPFQMPPNTIETRA